MRKIIIFQHVGHEPLGTLNPMLKAAGFRIRYVNFGRSPGDEPSLDSYSGLIVLGGPMGVYEADRYLHLKYEMRAIESALKRQIPVLGICLGAQLLAHVLGARVFKAAGWELGWYPLDLLADAKRDPLFGTWGSSERVFQMHQDTFTLPAGATHLASTVSCEGQAFRYGTNAYGLQFHLEADRPMIRRWLARTEHQEIIVASKGQFTPDNLIADTDRYIARAGELGAATFGKFIEMFGLPERGELLGSGSGKPSRLGE